MMAWDDNRPPKEPADVERLTLAGKHCTMKRGDIIVRDPSVWHKGTRNTTSMTRFLPGLVLDAGRVAKRASSL